jgi:hypothetical protein
MWHISKITNNSARIVTAHWKIPAGESRLFSGEPQRDVVGHYESYLINIGHDTLTFGVCAGDDEGRLGVRVIHNSRRTGCVYYLGYGDIEIEINGNRCIVSCVETNSQHSFLLIPHNMTA